MERITRLSEELKPGAGGAVNGGTTPDFTIDKYSSHVALSWYVSATFNGTIR
jgi:hypothetical protein